MKRNLIALALVVVLVAALSVGTFAAPGTLLLTTDGVRFEAVEDGWVIGFTLDRLSLGRQVAKEGFDLLGAAFFGIDGFGVEGFVVKGFEYGGFPLEGRIGVSLPFEKGPTFVAGLGYRF